MDLSELDSGFFFETLDDLRGRWPPIRTAVLTMVAGYPSETVRDLFRQLHGALVAQMATFSQLTYLVLHAEISERLRGISLVEAERSRALRLANELSEAIRTT